MSDTTTLCGLTIKTRRDGIFVYGPFDYVIATGGIGSRFGQLVSQSYGITEELVFVYDFHRPATPVLPAQLADMPHVQANIAKRLARAAA